MTQLIGEEYEAVAKDLNEVLKKHNCEIQIESVIKFVKTDGTTETPKIDKKAKGVR